MANKRIAVAHMLAIMTVTIWGTTFISTKILLRDFKPVEILLFRFLIGYGMLFIICPRITKLQKLKEELFMAGAGMCGVTLYFLMENIALTYSLASNVAIILSVAPMFTALLAHVMLEGERLRSRFFMGFAAAIVGISLVAFNGEYVLRLNPLGDILAVLAAAVWAVYSILMKKIAAFSLNTVQSTRRVFMYGIIFMLPTLPFFGFQPGLSRFASMTNLFNIFFLGIFASAICFATWNWSVDVLGAVKTSVYIYAAPVITVITAGIILKERITLMAGLGAVLTLSGVYISQFSSNHKHSQNNQKAA